MVADSAAKNTASNVLPVGTLARRWLAVCIIGWALLIPVDAWLADQKALRWRYVDAATKTVLGAAAAVALGGLILNHIQSRLDTERQDAQRQEWLNRHFAFAVLTHDAMRRTLGQLAAVAYSAVSATGALSAKVPLATLRADIARRPHVPAHLNNLNELIAALSELAHDTVSNTLTSPVGNRSTSTGSGYLSAFLPADEGDCPADEAHGAVRRGRTASTYRYRRDAGPCRATNAPHR